MEDIVDKLRHPKETRYGRILYIFGVLFWLLIGLSILASIAVHPSSAIILVLEIGLYGGIAAIGIALYRAYIFGHYVLLGPEQMPHLYQMVVDGARTLGLQETPQAFVHNSNGVINAFATRLLGSPCVMLASSLIDADTDAQVKFVIGHELGHHAAGHLNFWKNAIKFPGHIVPFLGPAYSRARELTCDRIGAYLSQDQAVSTSALAMLACGSAKLNGRLNRAAFEAQEEMVPPFFGWLHKIFSHYPRHTTRVLEVSSFYKTGV